MTERRIVSEDYSVNLRPRNSNPLAESFTNNGIEESVPVTITFPVKETESTVVLTNEVEPSERLESVIECAVCLQNCIHPVKLPCSHIFCYLCVKGVAFQSRRCAMCRQEIPTDFLLHPQLVDRAQLEKETPLEDGYQWFYEGRNGWWQYDDRTAVAVEEKYKLGEKSFELLIAGSIYIIDFERLIQYPKQRTGRIRKIKRGPASQNNKLGIAGIRS